MSIKSLVPGEEVAGLRTVVTSESPESSAELWAAAAAAAAAAAKVEVSLLRAML